MKILFNWLKDYTAIKISPEQLAQELTLRSVEVESVHCLDKGFERIVVGHIESIKKHPHADRLHIVCVDVGKKQRLNIVCGGINLAVGQKVPVALDGATLPSGITIKKTIIRQVESEGMICSSEELGFDSEGQKKIMVLNEQVKTGQPIVDALGLKDWALEIKTPANRGDLNSHLGLAREIGALTWEKVHTPTPVLPRPKKGNTLGHLEVEVKKQRTCRRWSGLVIDGITMQPSPQWLQNRLRNIGIRSINYVVDVTNYIMADLGQPLHAFDYHKILGPNKKITIRPAETGETVKTLDGTVRSLQDGMLIIEDEERIIDLAGIMGGENSAVDDQTRTIILQAAIFDPLCIRKTSRLLGHRTEAVSFFEKGIDPDLPEVALNQAFQLMKEIDHRITIINAIDERYEQSKVQTFRFLPSTVKRLTGLDIPTVKMKQIFKSLKCALEVEKDHWLITPPSFRLDIEHSQDFVEEIVRIFGYDKLPATLPKIQLHKTSNEPFIAYTPEIKNIMTSRGFYEVINYSFISPKWQNRIAENFPIESIIVTNPLSEDHRRLRTELLSSLLHTSAENLKYQDEVAFFEIGKTYHPVLEASKREVWRLGCIIANRKADEYENEFSMIHGVLNDLGGAFFEHLFRFESTKRENEADIFAEKNLIGRLVFLETKLLREWGIDKGSAVFAQLDLDAFLKKRDKKGYFRAFPSFPPVKLDLSMRVQKTYRIGDIMDTMCQAGAPLVQKIILFDRFAEKTFGSNSHSLAFHLFYQDQHKTLTLEEAEATHQKIIQKLETIFRAKIR